MTKCCTIDGVQSGIIWSVEQIIMGIAIINDIRLRGAGTFRDVGDFLSLQTQLDTLLLDLPSESVGENIAHFI